MICRRLSCSSGKFSRKCQEDAIRHHVSHILFVTVLPRVFYLIQHAVSPSTLAHIAVEARQSLDVSLADIIPITIARLINLLPGTRFEAAVLRDLVQMIGDLRHIQQHYLSCSEDELVQMILFPLTTDESTLDNKTGFILDLPRLETVTALQSTLACALSLFLEYRRNGRLYPAEDCVELSVKDGFEPSNSYFAGLFGDPEPIRDLVGSLRQIILRPDCCHEQRIPQLHSQRAVLASLKISEYLLFDCEAGLLHEFVRMHICVVAVKAALEFLATAGSEVALSPPQTAVAEGLTRLIRRSVFPRSGLSQVTLEEDFGKRWCIQRCAFPFLMDCFRVMYHTNGSEYALKHTELSTAVLESLAFLSGSRSGNAFDPYGYFWNALTGCDDICRNIFRAVRDPKLAPFAGNILLSVMKMDVLRWGLCCSGLSTMNSCDKSGSAEFCKLDTSLKRQSAERHDPNSSVVCEQRTASSQRADDSACLFENLLLELTSDTLSACSLDIPTSDTGVCLVSVFLMIVVSFVNDNPRTPDPSLLTTMAASVKYVASWAGRKNEQRSAVDVNCELVSFAVDAARRAKLAAPSLLESVGSLWNELEILSSDQRYQTWTTPSIDTEDARHNFAGRNLKESRQQHSIRLRLVRNRLGMPNTGVIMSDSNNDVQTLRSAFLCKDTFARAMAWESVAFLLPNWSQQRDTHQFLRVPWPQKETANSMATDNTVINFLLETALGDKDCRLRDYASRHIGKALLAGKPCVVLVAFDQDDELTRVTENEQLKSSVHWTKVIESCISRFFRHLDELLHKYSVGSQSSTSDVSLAGEPAEDILLLNRAASRSLLSICEACDLETLVGRCVFEGTLFRVARLWSSTDDKHIFEISGLCFAEILRLQAKLDRGIVIQARLLWDCAPSLFRAALLPLTEDADNIRHVDRQYRMVSNVLEVFASVGRTDDSDTSDDVSLASSSFIVGQALEDCLPAVLGRMILDMKRAELRLTAGFKLFHLAQKQIYAKIEIRGNGLLSHLNNGDRPMREKKLKRPWTKDLDHHIYLLAQAPHIVERLLPLVLAKADKQQLVFLVNDVLQRKRDLHTMLSGREQLMLKVFIKELGRGLDPEPRLRALILASRAKNDKSFLTDSDRSYELSSSDQQSTEHASSWVSSHFMYLLVNVVQARWHTKDTWEKIHDLRSLYYVFDFIRLYDKTVAQYLPQMMATVNGAIAQQNDDESAPKSLAELRLLAVQCLSKFIQLVGPVNWELVGE